jgi:hypothetical protein
MQKSAKDVTPWTVTLRDHGNPHYSAATTQVDKVAFPTVDAAIAQAAKQLGVTELRKDIAHTWWEVY